MVDGPADHPPRGKARGRATDRAPAPGGPHHPLRVSPGAREGATVDVVDPREDPLPGYRRDSGHEHAHQGGGRRHHERGAGQPGPRRSRAPGRGPGAPPGTAGAKRPGSAHLRPGQDRCADRPGCAAGLLPVAGRTRDRCRRHAGRTDRRPAGRRAAGRFAQDRGGGAGADGRPGPGPARRPPRDGLAHRSTHPGPGAKRIRNLRQRKCTVSQPFKGTINTDIRDSVPDWSPFEPPKAPDGAPNVVYIVLDDVGFSAMSSYGGPIDTPNIDRIADAGIRYTQWHTTALCSPTRSCLLTGRNHTRNSMACITEAAIGFPNASGTIPPENGMLSEILAERGWNTYMVGKWHLCPTVEMNVASTRRNWPSGRGFERWYGFLGAETNQWYPDLVYDNHPVDQPKLPEEGYHLTDDITNKAIEFITDAKVIAPDKPFFLYYAPGAAHAPHHVSKEWADKFKGRFDMGYEAMREQTLARQKEMGIVPADTELPPVNPIGTHETRQGPDGQPFPPLDETRPWDSLSAEEKRLFARMAEVYAGFLAHADHHVGRLLDYLEESGQRDNTMIIVVSDNGASGEGGPDGSVNEMLFANGIPDNIQANLAMIDELGGTKTYNHYRSEERRVGRECRSRW